MILLVSGATHTGKTVLAQKLIKQTSYSCLSIDLLKMGLIRSGTTELSVSDDGALRPFLWKIVKEIIKTAIENRQNLIVEGIYIPFDWQNDFSEDMLGQIKSYFIVMSKDYIENHFEDIKKFAAEVEQRQDESYLSKALLIANNQAFQEGCEQNKLPYHLIDKHYDVSWEL